MTGKFYKTKNLKGILEIDYRVRKFCKLPYPGHKNGCPNYGNSANCPPIVGLVEEIYDLDKPHYFLYYIFDIAAHVEVMKVRHPEWTDRQLRNCLYWQGTVRKGLTILSKRIVKGSGRIYTLIPEAMGVHVFKTMENLGIHLQRVNHSIIYKVALIGYPKAGK